MEFNAPEQQRQPPELLKTFGIHASDRQEALMPVKSKVTAIG